MNLIDILELERKHHIQMAEAKARRDADKARMNMINNQASLIASISLMESHAIIAGMVK